MATGMLMVFAAALILRLLYAGWMWSDDLRAFDGGDYRLYEIGAEDWLRTRAFENSLFLVRPPGFSLLIALLGLRAEVVLLTNAALGALTASLCIPLARQFRLGWGESLMAGALMAAEPVSIVYSAYLGAEPLANLLLLLALILFIAAMRADRHAAIPWAVAAAACLVASALVRPAAYLLWLILTGWALLHFRARWRAIVSYSIVCVLGIGAWMAHNGSVFGNPTFSTIGIYNLLYYRAASVESLGSGAAIEDTYTELSRRVELRLGRDAAGVNPGTRHGHYAATASLQSAMQAIAVDVFLAYPVVYLLTIPLGLFRTLILLHSPVIWLQVVAGAVNIALLALAALGMWRRWRGERALFWLALVVCAYFIGGTLLVQTSGIDTRARTMLTPLLVTAAATWLGRGRWGETL